MRSRTHIVATLALAGAVLLSGCGGDTAEETSATRVEVATTEPGGGSSGGESGALGASVLGGRCQEIIAAYGEALSSGTGGAGAAGAADALEGLSDAVPGEIADDFSLVAGAVRDYTEAVADSGWDPQSGELPTEEQMAVLEGAGSEFSSEEFEAASDRIEAYLEESCR